MRSPTELVAMLERTRPPRYSPIESGDAKRLRKFRDHTSSRNAIVTPCMTRVKKSHRRTAPRSTGTKSKPAMATVLRYRVCLLYTSDAADDLLCVDLGGRRIIK